MLSKGRLVLDGVDKPANCKIRQFRFSGHAGRSQLHDYLHKIETDAKVFAIHGEQPQCNTLAEWARKELNLEAYAPAAGETYRL